MTHMYLMGKSCILTVLVFCLLSCSSGEEEAVWTGTVPELFPDYTEVTIPANIAPLNFRITDKETERMIAEFRTSSHTLKVKGRQKIMIPPAKWRKLLDHANADTVEVRVSVRKKNKWYAHNPFHIYVRKQQIDPYLTYRKIAPGYESYSKMGIYQRDITSFHEVVIVDNTMLPGKCVNCHAFRNNDPTQMLFHVRGKPGGTMLIQDGKLDKLAVSAESGIAGLVYPFWHPSGKYIAFSSNRTAQNFHSGGPKKVEVYDTDSDVFIVDPSNHRVISGNGQLCRKEAFETYPHFTPDGRQLLFCTAESRTMPAQYKELQYSLCSVSFDPLTGKVGEQVDTLIHAPSVNKSVAFPRTSPDGRYIMVTLFDYGTFPIWHKEADLYVIDRQDGALRELHEVNSEDTESYHTWSSDSEWFAFSSRRRDGLYTNLYIAAIDGQGIVSKPVLLPQKDPDYYDFTFYSFNIPEFSRSKITIGSYEIVQRFTDENVHLLQ